MGSSSAHEAFVAAPSAPGAQRFTPAERRQARALAMVLALMAAFLAVELSFAFVARSDVLLADALHLSADVFALIIALVAIGVSARRPTARFTYGLRRAEPIAAIVNALLVLGATAMVVSDAIADLRRGGGEPRADVMLYVSVAALFVNAIAAWLIHVTVETSHAGGDDEVKVQELTALHGHAHAHPGDHGHDHHHHEEADEHHAEGGESAHSEPRHPRAPRSHARGHHLSLRGAWLHLFGDALASLAAVAAALLLKVGAPPQADPIASFVVAAILVVGASRLLKEATLVLLEASPGRLPVTEVREAILGVHGVAAVHSLHVWTLGAGHDAITAHVKGKALDPRLGPRVARALRDRFHVEYATVQVEVDEGACDTSPRSDAGDP